MRKQLLSSKDSPLHIKTVSRSNSDKEISMSTNNTENKKYLLNMKCERKVPAPDGFHVKKKKELESCSARMSEVSQHMNDILTAITRSLKDSDDDLQYLTCLLPIFKKLNDQKTECLQTLLNVMIEYKTKTSLGMAASYIFLAGKLRLPKKMKKYYFRVGEQTW